MQSWFYCWPCPSDSFLEIKISVIQHVSAGHRDEVGRAVAGVDVTAHKKMFGA